MPLPMAVARWVATFAITLRGETGPAFTRETWRAQWRYALPFGAAMAVAVPQNYFHQYAVSASVDAAAFAVYSVGCFQLPLVDLLFVPTSEILMVRIGELDAAHRMHEASGVFREAAHQEQDLAAIAARMHASLLRRTASDLEEFVTAVLVSVPPGSSQAEIVNCGHPSPLLLHHGVVTPLDPPEPSPPLGLLDLSRDSLPVYKVDFEPGDHILLYTDGITEARDEEGAFYRLDQDKSWTVYQNPDPMLDHVLRAVRAHAGPRLSDDIALLAVKRLPDPEL